MDEAEKLCDRVAVVDAGKVIALGSPQELIARLGGDHFVEFALNDGTTVALAGLKSLPAVVSARQEGDEYCLAVTAVHLALPALLEHCKDGGGMSARLTTRHATLEDVFVTLTGRHLPTRPRDVSPSWQGEAAQMWAAFPARPDKVVTNVAQKRKSVEAVPLGKYTRNIAKISIATNLTAGGFLPMTTSAHHPPHRSEGAGRGGIHRAVRVWRGFTPRPGRMRHSTMPASARVAWPSPTSVLCRRQARSLVAVADVDLSRTAEVRKLFSAGRIYQDWRELLDKEKNLNSVNVSTPDHMHAPITMRAIQQGLHVYTQKPSHRRFTKPGS